MYTYIRSQVKALDKNPQVFSALVTCAKYNILISCFGLLVTSALGFKARVDPFCALSHFLRFISGETLADCMEVGMATEPF